MQTLEEAKITRGCLYMAMPVQEVSDIALDKIRVPTLVEQYGTLQWGKFDEIQAKGYQAAMKILAKWEEEGKLPSGFIEGKDANAKRKKGQSVRRNSI